jgi:signal transduction histidine kinase
MSIRTRITLFGLAVVVAVLTCFSGGIFTLVSSSLPQNQDKELARRAETAVATLATAPPAAFTAQPPATPVNPADSDDIFVVLYDQNLLPLNRSGPVAIPNLPASLLPAGGTTRAATVTWDGVSVRVAVKAWQRSDLGRSGYVVAAQAVHRQQNDRRGFFVLLLISLIVTVLAAALAIWLVVRRALRPLQQLTATADEIGRWPGLERRLPLSGKLDDLGRLAISFNGMLDRLALERRRTAEALAAQQRFAADASHELRTPLTTIRSNAGFLQAHPDAEPADRAAAVSDIASESERMTRLVTDLLMLARADAGQAKAFAPGDLGQVAGDVIRQARTKHPQLTVHLHADPAGAWIDRDAIVQLLWILLDNAARYARQNIWVLVWPSGPVARMSVADDGPGIPPAALPTVFGRFVRAEPNADGTGLGLSIAHAIVVSHRGTIMAANNDRGGAIITVDLPLVPAG